MHCLFCGGFGLVGRMLARWHGKQRMRCGCVRSKVGQSTAAAGRCDMAAPYRAAAAPAFSAVPLGQRKAHRRQHVRRQHLGVVAQAAATAEAALKETDLHTDLKKALANVKPKVG